MDLSSQMMGCNGGIVDKREIFHGRDMTIKQFVVMGLFENRAMSGMSPVLIDGISLKRKHDHTFNGIC